MAALAAPPSPIASQSVDGAAPTATASNHNKAIGNSVTTERACATVIQRPGHAEVSAIRTKRQMATVANTRTAPSPSPGTTKREPQVGCTMAWNSRSTSCHPSAASIRLAVPAATHAADAIPMRAPVSTEFSRTVRPAGMVNSRPALVSHGSFDEEPQPSSFNARVKAIWTSH
jgi:hypothetical protein